MGPPQDAFSLSRTARRLGLLSQRALSNSWQKLIMAPGAVQDLSAKRAQFAGSAGIRGIIENGKTTAIATFAALGGFVYGCMLPGGTLRC